MGKFKNFLEAVKLEDVNTTPGKNKTVVIMGRFHPPTLGHKKLIEKAVKKYNAPVSIFIVKGAKTTKEKAPFPFALQKEIFNKMTKVPHRVYIISTGFVGEFIHELRNNDFEPVALMAGSDRLKTYKAQVKRYSEELNLNMKVVEIKRGEEDISASKVREALKNDDVETFEKMMDKKVHNTFKKLKRYVK